MEMEFSPVFETIGLAEVASLAASSKENGWRYVQTLAVNTDNGVDVVYSFMDMQTGKLVNSTVKGVKHEDVVPSISGQFLEAFVFENEIHDLFGVNFEGIAIDFQGNFYLTAVKEPMTVISPEQKAAREKAAKVAAAKAAKEAKAAQAEGATQTSGDATVKQAALDDMEEKLKALDPEKAAKVRAAMEAKAKKESAAKQDALEEKLKGLDPEKAAKVRAAMEAKAKKAAASGSDGEGA